MEKTITRRSYATDLTLCPMGAAGSPHSRSLAQYHLPDYCQVRDRERDSLRAANRLLVETGSPRFARARKALYHSFRDRNPVFLHNKGTAIEIDLTIVKWRRDASLLYLIDAFSIRILLFT